jgi:hypothetical protein
MRVLLHQKVVDIFSFIPCTHIHLPLLEPVDCIPREHNDPNPTERNLRGESSLEKDPWSRLNLMDVASPFYLPDILSGIWTPKNE